MVGIKPDSAYIYLIVTQPKVITQYSTYIMDTYIYLYEHIKTIKMNLPFPCDIVVNFAE